MQNLEKSRLIRLGVKLLLALITFWILIWPHLRRAENLLLSGKESYYHLKEGTIAVILSFLNQYTGINNILLAKLLPISLGILSMLLFYAILKKFKLNYAIVILSTLILVSSPSFIYLFGTLNAYGFTVFIFLLSIYLLLERKELLGVAALYLIPFFGIVPTFLGLLLLLVYSLKNQRFRLFLGALPSLALLYFSPTKILPSYGSRIISDFGGYYGLGLFIVLFSLFGLKHLWQKKYKHALTYLTIIFLCVFSLLNIRVLSYLNLILAGLAALGLIGLIKSEWRSKLIKQMSILIMVYGLIFSGLSYINFISSDLPNEEVVEMIEYLETLPGEEVFSHPYREPWIEYAGKNFIEDENLFYTKNIDQALAIIKSKKIKYLWIDEEMEEMVWGEEDEGLQFLLKYSKHFKKNKVNDYVTLWEVEEEN